MTILELRTFLKTTVSIVAINNGGIAAKRDCGEAFYWRPYIMLQKQSEGTNSSAGADTEPENVTRSQRDASQA